MRPPQRSILNPALTSQGIAPSEFPDGSGTFERARALLKSSRTAIRRGDLDEARLLLHAAVQIDPDYTEAWLGLAWLARDRRERKVLLHRVLTLEPEHRQAQGELARSRWARSRSISRFRTGGGRAVGWALGLSALAVGVLVVVLLIWWPLDASAKVTTSDGLTWWQNAPPLPLVPTATPEPVPTPTLTPSQIAAQFAPQLRTALSEKSWDRAMEIVAIISSVDPSGDEVRQWAFTTSMQYGQALVDTGPTDEAQIQFDRAVALAPDDEEAHLWQQTTQMYLSGREAAEAGQWEAAIESFTLAEDGIPSYGDLSTRLVEAYRYQGEAAIEEGNWSLAVEGLTHAYERTPDDPIVVDLLAVAHRQRGIDLQDRATRKRFQVGVDELKQARADLKAALTLRPDDAKAQAHLDQVTYFLFPPKRIEVDISEQRLYAWEGDALVHKFPVSTGLRGQDTATGTFQVLDKIPMAYSRIWRLKMPNWIGIYYVQGIENGFHALPIRPDGSRMWAGLLGRRASYGCIVLDIKAGKTLYNWVEIGTRVDIHR